jgi:hypothetical protein
MRFSVLVKHDDYIVSDHVLHQVRTIPGVTYLDLITRFLAEKGISPRSFEIKHVLFREPVATSVHFDKKVTFQFTQQENGWLVETTSFNASIEIVFSFIAFFLMISACKLTDASPSAFSATHFLLVVSTSQPFSCCVNWKETKRQFQSKH